MTQQTEPTQQLAYVVFYEAYRAGATRKFQVMYKADEPISIGEALQSMTEQVCRAAVGNGQANSVDDVSITGVSLLNPMATETLPEFTQERDEYVDKLELKNTEQWERIVELEAAFVELSDKLSSFAMPDAIINIDSLKELVKKHELIYNTCKNKQ